MSSMPFLQLFNKWTGSLPGSTGVLVGHTGAPGAFGHGVTMTLPRFSDGVTMA
jgi:hypothetical protein